MSEPGTPAPPTGPSPRELNLRAGMEFERLDALPDDATVDDTMHVVADIAVAAGGLHDDEGALLMPLRLRVLGAERRPSAGGDPTIYLTVNEGGGAENEILPAVDFRGRFQVPFVDSTDQPLRPYRTFNGNIYARNDPDGEIRSVSGDGSDLPAGARARWEAEQQAAREVARGGERAGPEYPAMFDTSVYVGLRNRDGTLPDGMPDTRPELRNMLEALPPEERQRVVDEAINGFGEDYLHYGGWSATETIERNTRVILDELGTIAWWSQDFREDLRHELATTIPERQMADMGYEFNRDVTPPLIQTPDGRRVNPWQVVRQLRDTLPHYADLSDDQRGVLTVEQLDNAVDGAFRSTWDFVDQRLAGAPAPAPPAAAPGAAPSPAEPAVPAAGEGEPDADEPEATERGRLTWGRRSLDEQVGEWRETAGRWVGNVARGAKERATNPQGRARKTGRLIGNAVRYGRLTSAEAPDPPGTVEDVMADLDKLIAGSKALAARRAAAPRNPRSKRKPPRPPKRT